MVSENLIWYASYGSNLFGERFACYIEGGQAPGSGKVNDGARDQTPPRDERAAFLPYQLYFAHSSKTWQKGGIAFLDTERDDSLQTLSYLWLITAEQFVDIARQENGRPELEIDFDAVLRDGHQVCGDGLYADIRHLEDRDGYPVLTMTHPGGLSGNKPTKPSAAYLRCIIAGLREVYGLNKQGSRKYLKDIPGIAGSTDTSFLNKCFEQTSELLEEESDS